MYITQKVLKDANIDGAYIVEMVQCETGDVVHAFEISNPVDSSMTPCKGRPVEKGCYDLLFTLNDDAQMNGAGELMTSPEKGNGKRNWLLFGLILVTTLIIALAARNRRKKPKDDNPNLIQLGDYLYDKINAHLIYQNERIELTGKEAELLMVLYESPNETIEREIILNKVWGDEGDYVGRTLDVFISKLRKKLESDSRLRIVNVRGVGYRFVMDVGGEQ